MILNDGAETMSLDGGSKGVPFRRLTGGRLREVYYLQVWPNLLVSIHPDYVMTHILEPLSSSTTRIVCAWLFPPEARERADFDPAYATEFWDLTNRQDWAACEGVQRGVASRGYRQGPLSDQERIVHQAIALAARGYLEGGPPAPVSRSRAAAS
jgi:Rieske 2Fe-2S family protein